MMVDRRHAENALAGALVPEDLDDHRQRRDHAQPADEDEDEFVLRGHRDRRTRAAQREAARVAHEDRGGGRVEPEAGPAGADDRRGDSHEPARHGDVRYVEIFASLDFYLQIDSSRYQKVGHYY